MRRTLSALAVGLPLSLAVTEGVCHLARDGAFAHVNFYVADAKLGVRLEPGAGERISFSGNPVTTVRTNSDGYRGADWPRPGTPEVLVVGDSQAFGLGVEEGETMAAVVAGKLGRSVLNAGVPTYGPDEYLAVVREQAEKRALSDIVIVLNAANDFFELDRPNRDRHVVWDGWAVRTEIAPDPGMDFPGRRWLFSRSHAVFLARQAWFGGEGDYEAVESEGSAKDLLPRVAQQQATRTAAAEKLAGDEQVIAEGVRNQVLAARNPGVENSLAWALQEARPDLFPEREGIALQAAIEGKAAGDLVFEAYAEAARPVKVTAEQLEAGAKLRSEMPALLRTWLAEHPNEPYLSDSVRGALQQWDVQRGRGTVEAAGVAAVPLAESSFHGFLGEAKAVADAEGANLTLVVLPLDVQVSAEEWKKYGETPIPMEHSLALLDEVARDADRLGARVVLPLDALRAAEPGAFLDGDIHLSPKGQRTVGEAVAAAIAGPAPARPAGAGLPEGRSRVPFALEWEGMREIVVKGSTAAGCATRQAREWLRVDCGPGGVTLVDAPLEAMVTVTPTASRLLVPLLPGRKVVAEFAAGGRLTVDGDGKRFEPATVTAAITSSATSCPTPDGWIGSFDRGCAELASCDERLACADGRRLALPSCELTQSNAGSSGHCFDRCDDAHACAAGVCTPWQGGSVCL